MFQSVFIPSQFAKNPSDRHHVSRRADHRTPRHISAHHGHRPHPAETVRTSGTARKKSRKRSRKEQPRARRGSRNRHPLQRSAHTAEGTTRDRRDDQRTAQGSPARSESQHRPLYRAPRWTHWTEDRRRPHNRVKRLIEPFLLILRTFTHASTNEA